MSQLGDYVALCEPLTVRIRVVLVFFLVCHVYVYATRKCNESERWFLPSIAVMSSF